MATRLDGYNGKYDWDISADGFGNGEYSNYIVNGYLGANIFTFYLDTSSDTILDRDEMRQNDNVDQIVADPIEVDDTEYVITGERESLSVNSVKTYSSAPNAYSTVKVYMHKTDVSKTYNRDVYLYTLVSSETYSASAMKGWGLTDTQVWQFYGAQALVANSYIEYKQKVDTNKHTNDVCSNSGCCHNFDVTAKYQLAIEAVDGLFVTIGGKASTCMLYYKPSTSTYDYLNAEWFSSCKGKGTVNGTSSGVVAKACSDIAVGSGGHRRGFCQMGAAKRAKNGENAATIAKYYFSNVDTGFATLVSR